MATVTKSQGQWMVHIFGVVSILFILCTVHVGMNYMSIDVPQLTSVTDRMAFAMRWLILSILPLILCVANVASTRFFNMETAGVNPTLKISQQIVDVKQRILQNTLEQTLIHIPAVLVLSSYLEGAKLKLVPIFVFLFLCGRLLFSIGYLGSSNMLHRGLGFAMTFMNNIFIVGYCVYCFFVSGAELGLTAI